MFDLIPETTMSMALKDGYLSALDSAVWLMLPFLGYLALAHFFFFSGETLACRSNHLTICLCTGRFPSVLGGLMLNTLLVILFRGLDWIVLKGAKDELWFVLDFEIFAV